MAVAQSGTGARATVGAIASQIHPVFMLPPLAASWFGATLVADASVPTATVHSLAIFAAVYTAHVKDGYVDYYLRGEDDDHPMTRRGCHICLVLATAVFLLCLALLGALAGWGAVAITAPTWLIGYLHAPQLDMHLLGATLGYPVGIGLALVGGYYVQATGLDALPAALALVLVVLLAGVKIVDDEQDVRYDRSIGKPTVAAVRGRTAARRLAGVTVLAAMLLVVAFVIVGVFPVGALLSILAVGLIVFVAFRKQASPATAMLIRGCYVFLAVLIAAVWLQPG